MTLAFIVLWALATALAAAGLWLPAAALVMLAVLAGTRHRIEGALRGKPKPAHVRRVYVP